MKNWINKIFRHNTPCVVRIKMEKTIAFVGTVESFDISTYLDGSDCKVAIKFRAEDIIKKLKVS